MKIWAFSDPHVDVGHNRVPFHLPDPKPEADVLLIAGDVREGLRKSITWLDTCTGWKGPIIYVAGNHDFYRVAIDDERMKAREHLDRINQSREFRGLGVIHVLQDSWVQFGGVRFIGATLWTDYCLEGEAWKAVAMITANDRMNDHHLIRVAKDNYRKFRAADAEKEHHVSRSFIHQALLDTPPGIARVVVTHHTPSRKSVDYTRYAGNLLNAAYSSQLDNVVALSDLWVHGHTHHSFDYDLGHPDGRRGRVVCNPRGYAGDNLDFQPSLVLEVPSGEDVPKLPPAADPLCGACTPAVLPGVPPLLAPREPDPARRAEPGRLRGTIGSVGGQVETPK